MPRGFFAAYTPLSLLACLVLLTTLCGCQVQQTALRFLPVGDVPLFIDDDDAGDLLLALDEQIAYLRNLNGERPIVINGRIYSPETLLAGLRSFRHIIETTPDPLQRNRLINDSFAVYQATGRTGDGRMLLTGYYEPLFPGSLHREGPYRYPLYRVPDSLVHEVDPQTGKRRVGRVDQHGHFIPYWTRAELETGDHLDGYELVYLRDPLDAYLMHVQGSGRILLPDGAVRAVRFAGTNGQSYNSLGKLFVDRGIMAREAVSVPAMRTYFADHPELISDFLQHNPRYIFFDWGNDSGSPRGSLGLPLTPGRSIAIDHEALPTGAIGYLLGQRPVFDEHGDYSHWRAFGRFVLPQDSGAAIKGPGRVDLFWGAGNNAAYAAGHTNHEALLYFLLPKQP